MIIVAGTTYVELLRWRGALKSGPAVMEFKASIAAYDFRDEPLIMTNSGAVRDVNFMRRRREILAAVIRDMGDSE
jgi:hypothetical protein